jgi:hypothetical protein
LAFFPPPYTCASPTCPKPNKQFTPSTYYLSKNSALTKPPKYCSSACFMNRTHRVTSNTDRRVKMAYKGAIELMVPRYNPDNPRLESESLPKTAAGGPWIGVEPIIPQHHLHPQSQNTIHFWDWALNTYTDDLTLLEYNAFLFEFVIARSGPHPSDVHIQECWRLWPYIAQYTDDRYSLTTLASMTNAYLLARRTYNRQVGAMPTEKLNTLVRQLYGAAIRNTDNPNPRNTKFMEEWLRPLLGFNAPYEHTRNPRYQSHFSRIQIQLRNHYDATKRLVEMDTVLTYLDPLTAEQYQMLKELHQKLMRHVTKCYPGKKPNGDPYPGKAKWPWGPNCYSAMHIPEEEKDKFRNIEDLKWHMYHFPTFNLPEPFYG